MNFISSKSMYGLAAVFELALLYGSGCLQIRDIAKSGNIPEDYLRQLLILLKKANIVESVRGAWGGYVLKKNPAEITVGEVIRALDGPIKLINIKPKRATLQTCFVECQEKIEKIFERSLEDLILEKQKQERNIVYQI